MSVTREKNSSSASIKRIPTCYPCLGQDTSSFHNLVMDQNHSTLCGTICHPSDRQAAASSLSADLDKITSWSNMWKCLSILIYLTPSQCLSKRTIWNTPSPPTTFPTIHWKKSFHSSFWVSRSAMIFPGKATFPTWPPKPVADWASSVIQSPSLAHLSS